MSVDISDFLANNIRHVFERTTMYGSAVSVERTLKAHFRFAAAVDGFESRLESETARLVMLIGYPSDHFAQNYYREYPDAHDSGVRDFVLSRFSALADALDMRLPAKSREFGEFPPAVVADRLTCKEQQDVKTRRAIAAVSHWVRTALEKIVADPTSSRSAHDLEHDMCGLPWVWGIMIGEARQVHQRREAIREEYRCDTTIAAQFFRQRPWATPREGMRFVFTAYEGLCRSTLADERIWE